MTDISTDVPQKGPLPTWELEGHVKIPEEYKLLLTEVCSLLSGKNFIKADGM